LLTCIILMGNQMNSSAELSTNLILMMSSSSSSLWFFSLFLPILTGLFMCFLLSLKMHLFFLLRYGLQYYNSLVPLRGIFQMNCFRLVSLLQGSLQTMVFCFKCHSTRQWSGFGPLYCTPFVNRITFT